MTLVIEHLAAALTIALGLAGGLLLRDAARHLIAARRDDANWPELMSTGSGLEPPDVARETVDQVWSHPQRGPLPVEIARLYKWRGSARARMAEAMWWVVDGCLHDGACPDAAAAAAQPLHFVVTVEDALNRVEDDGLMVCASCDPLDGLHREEALARGDVDQTAAAEPPREPPREPQGDVPGSARQEHRNRESDVQAAAEGRYNFLAGRTVT